MGFGFAFMRAYPCVDPAIDSGHTFWMKDALPSTPLDQVLHHLRMSGTFYCRGQFESPWGVAFPEAHGEARFHLVTEGVATFYGPGIESAQLHAGDFVLLPRGTGHTIADKIGSPLMSHKDIVPEYISERYAHYQYGRGGPGTRIICVSVRFDDPTALRLLSLLPAAIYVRGGSADSEWFGETVRFIAAEAKNLRVGGETIITRLADVLVVQAIRSWIEHEPEARTGWLGAVQDRQIGKAIALIHRRPEHGWTLAALGKEVGMSRSALSARFKELVGESVMRYLATWRMQLALASLRQDRIDIGELAESVGYQSESAFNRAFKRYVGIAPGAARGSVAELIA